MPVRTLSTGLLLIGAGLLLNAHVSSAQQGSDSEKAKSVAATATQPAAAGKAAARLDVPDFTLMDQNGEPVTLSNYAGKIVVLEWVNPQCPFVQRHYNSKTMQTLASKYQDKGVVWLAINSTSSAGVKDNKAWVDKYELSYPILDDNLGKVGREYGAKTTPHVFVIDRTGKVVYKGAIDNDPQGEKSDKVNYVDQTLQQLVQGKTVELKETKSYGCSVKYSKTTAEAR